VLTRLFLLAVGAFLVWIWLARTLKARLSRATPATPDGPRDAEGMVRDRVCNTFVPRTSALVLRDGDEQLFFCSEDCRAEYRREHAGPARPVA
jgi:hypothetical protein